MSITRRNFATSAALAALAMAHGPLGSGMAGQAKFNQLVLDFLKR